MLFIGREIDVGRWHRPVAISAKVERGSGGGRRPTGENECIIITHNRAVHAREIEGSAKDSYRAP